MEVGLWENWEEHGLFDQLMQSERGKQKRLPSFRANKSSFLFLLFPVSQTRLLLPVALVDLPPSHTHSKYMSHRKAGCHAVVNILPLESMIGLQFVRTVR